MQQDRPDVELKIVDDVTCLSSFVDLEIAVWGLNPRDAVPLNMLHAVIANGGSLIGAYIQGESDPVGMTFGFPARYDGQWVFWSHMTGVHREYQRSGIGLMLKLRQREWALEHGFQTIRWTFDPLQAGNANFNLRLLGAKADRYYINYYGEMADTINAGLPSDRVVARWDLRKQRLTPPKHDGRPSETWPLSADRSGKPHLGPAIDTAFKTHFVEIPARISDLQHADHDLALSWRLALRNILKPALDSGAVLTDFVRANDRCCYVLSIPVAWYMYVLLCADNSLYTGITNNLPRRIQQHNSARGAAYTASRRPVRCLAAWRFPNRVLAQRAEAAFKKQSRVAKLGRIESRAAFHDGTFVEP